MEQAEEWSTGRQYLDMSLLDEDNKQQETTKSKQTKTVAA